jgi:acyl-CoA dehydrogenase
MRSIGAAERALELMVRRGLSREAFGKPLARLGKNTETIAKARIEIEAMRLMVLRAAKAMDTLWTGLACNLLQMLSVMDSTALVLC